MFDLPEQRSEAAKLLQQIAAEYEAAQRTLSDPAFGTSQHAFITRKMEQMSHLHTQLSDLIGDVSMTMVAEHLNACPDTTHPGVPSGPAGGRIYDRSEKEEENA